MENTLNHHRTNKSQILINKITSTNFDIFPKWRNTEDDFNKSKLKSEILSFLEIVSGLDVFYLIKELLKETQNKEFQRIIKESKALKNIGKLYSRKKGTFFKPIFKRRIIRQLKSAGLTRIQSRLLGTLIFHG